MWAAANWGPETRLPLGGALAFLYPMWVFGWFVMGMHSRVLGYVILALTVVGNAALFTGVGFVFRQLRHRRWFTQWGTTALVYTAAYAAITFIAYRLM